MDLLSDKLHTHSSDVMAPFQNIDRDRMLNVLNQWNTTQIDFPTDICIHELIEAQVAKTPDTAAIVFEDQHLTYQQLNQRANQLAHYLRNLGVGPETLVGVYIDRSLEMVVAVLGILKAGGAYVPLDPAHPSDRTAFILQDTQVLAILACAELATRLPSQNTIICLDSDWETIAQQPLENPICNVNSENLMYVIYTSGSTGQPKGVMIPHIGICNQLHWRQTTFPLNDTDRVLQTISFSFDPSVWQIFWTLAFGAQLVLPRPDGHKDSAYLVDLIAQQAITVIALVPSMLRVFLEEQGLDRCHSLRHVFCGGEALPLDLQEQFFARFSDTRSHPIDLHNVYGPTEASIDATFWTCECGTHYPIAPIGRPIANTQIYILDEHLRPVEIGDVGELHIGGAGLARGYLNRPELTAEKFISNPFVNSELPGLSGSFESPIESIKLATESNQASKRLYKTGDLARYLPDGTIEFLGRIDHQVKIRGFRIELGEIEAALSRYPGIQQTIVVAREDVPGDKRLVAYWVFDALGGREPVGSRKSEVETFKIDAPLSPFKPPSSSELRCFLKEHLPDYMIPAAFVQLDALPLNPNGKVDRHTLPAPEVDRPDLERPFVAPQTSLEQELTSIWEQVLTIQPIGIQDNFFELGGNSLIAARLIAEIEAKFNKKIPLATLVQAPTIEQLACILQHDTWKTPWKALVDIQPNGSKPPLFCVHSRNGNVFSYYQLARYLGNEQPVYGLQARGVDGGEIPQFRIETMAADYIREIQTLQPNGPYFLSGYSFGGLVAYEMARQLNEHGQQVALLVLFDTYNVVGEWFIPLRFNARLSQYQHQFSTLKGKQKWTYLLEVAQSEVIGKFAYFQQKLTDKFSSNHSPSPLQGVDGIRAACAEAVRHYTPKPYSDRVIVFRAIGPLEAMLEPATRDPQLGWGNVVTGTLEVRNIPCHHFNMIDEPYVARLAEQLKDYL